jgi:hypothetical protein
LGLCSGKPNNKLNIEHNTIRADVTKADNRHYRTYGVGPKTGGDEKRLLYGSGLKP